MKGIRLSKNSIENLLSYLHRITLLKIGSRFLVDRVIRGYNQWRYQLVKKMTPEQYRGHFLLSVDWWGKFNSQYSMFSFL